MIKQHSKGFNEFKESLKSVKSFINKILKTNQAKLQTL